MLKHLDQTGPKPVYLLEGEERLLLEEARDLIKEKALAGALADFNLDVLGGKDLTAHRIVDAALMLPAFARCRVVLVKDLDKLAGEPDALIDYLASPSESTVLILVAEKLDARTKLAKALKKHATVLRFDRPKERDMPPVIQRRAKRLGLELDSGAVRALVDALGSDVAGVVSALEKLWLYVGVDGGTKVSAAHVEELISPVREESVFAFADAVGARNTRSAMEALSNMLGRNRGHPLALLGMIARHWRHLAEARAMLDSGARRAEAGAGLGLPPFVIDKVVGQAEKQRLPALVRGLEAIAQADQALKGGKLPGERVMERLVLTLTRTA